MIPSQATREKFNGWWRNRNQGAPLMKIVAERETPKAPLLTERPFVEPKDAYLDVEGLCQRYHNYIRTHDFLGEAFPNIDLNIGAGSLALYLGAQPEFRWDTVWFKEILHDGWENVPLVSYDPENPWLKLHRDIIRRAVELAQDQFLVTIPDIVENIDILSALRGPQDMCYDLFDYPDEVHAQLDALDGLYFLYYDQFYDIVKSKDGSCSYTAFQLWGEGKTAKVQCDFCALMNPTQFREFIQPSLRRQCQRLNNAVYHLDGPDEIKHLDALMEIDALHGIQWTHGAGHNDGLHEQWYAPIYDKVQGANKSLLLLVEDGDVNDWIEGTDRLVQRYGTSGLYLLYPDMDRRSADTLLDAAHKRWSKS